MRWKGWAGFHVDSLIDSAGSITWIETGRAISHYWDAGELNTCENPSSLAGSVTTKCRSLQLDGFNCVTHQKDPGFSLSLMVKIPHFHLKTRLKICGIIWHVWDCPLTCLFWAKWISPPWICMAVLAVWGHRAETGLRARQFGKEKLQGAVFSLWDVRIPVEF